MPHPLPAIDPPAPDRLGVLSSTAAVVRDARLVRLIESPIARLADEWADAPWPEQAGLDALHFTDGTERTANWVLLLDALNFCFWGEPGEPRWRVEWRGQVVDGYYALAAALARAVEEGRPLWDAMYLAALTEDELAAILRPTPGSARIPLSAERLTNAHEAGRVLAARYGGQFALTVDAAGGSAVALALLVAREFASFNDVTTWHGREVRFLKRAQICVADLHAAFRGERWGAFSDLDTLTAFADYKLPQILRQRSVLEYAPELADLVDHYVPLAAGSEAEVEIRAATVWAVELLRRALAERGVLRPASAIDYRLWAESQQPGPAARPYHRTRTMYY
jgi:hypothetical protein